MVKIYKGIESAEKKEMYLLPSSSWVSQVPFLKAMSITSFLCIHVQSYTVKCFLNTNGMLYMHLPVSCFSHNIYIEDIPVRTLGAFSFLLNIQCLSILQFLQPHPIKGSLVGSNILLLLTNSIALNILVQSSLCSCANISVRLIPRNGAVG